MEVMTIKEIAEYLRVSYATIYRLIRKGALPAFKIGGQWRIKKEELNKKIAETCIKTKTEITKNHITEQKCEEKKEEEKVIEEKRQEEQKEEWIRG